MFTLWLLHDSHETLCDSSSFFFKDTATPQIYTLSLHDALPISPLGAGLGRGHEAQAEHVGQGVERLDGHALLTDRKSTRLNSSHLVISYAVFCLKKKNNVRCSGPFITDVVVDLIAQPYHSASHD